MASLAEKILSSRKSLAGLSGDSVTRYDLLKLKAMHAETLECFETLAQLYEKETEMSATAELDIESLTSTDDSTAQETYRELIASLADGRLVKRDRLNVVLADAGRTLSDLKRHLSTAKKLRAARDLLRDGVKEHESLPALRDAKEQAVVAIEAERKRHEREMNDLLAAKRAADEAYSAVSLPRTFTSGDAANLLNRHLTPAAKARFRDLSNAAVGLGNRLVKLRDQHSQVEFVVKRNRSLAGMDGSIANDAKSRLSEGETRLAALTAELQQVAAEHATASAELDRFQNKMFSDWQYLQFDLDSGSFTSHTGSDQTRRAGESHQAMGAA